MDSAMSEANGPQGIDQDDIIGALAQGRRKFLALVNHVRPDLHRYCARMTGSVADGEDVVQDTLARTYYELSQLAALPPLDAAAEGAAEAVFEPDNMLARNQAVRAAIACFLQLAPAQRGCVILKDVLDHSTDEIAVELSLGVPAVKAALHRGRSPLSQRLSLLDSPP
jgi:DNA-directed RNA polymerase specialized sigma24 family protein